MPTQTSQIRLEAQGTDKTAAMFQSIKGQLEQTRRQVRELSRPAGEARRQMAGVGGALQSIAAIAGGGPIASGIGQVKGLANAVTGLGVSVSAALPAIGAAVAAWKLFEYAQRKVREAQEEAKRSAEELRATQERAAKAVVAAHERVIAKLRERRAAMDELRRARREGSAMADAAWETGIETEGLRRMLAATTEEERGRIARDVARALAESRHETASRTAADAAEDARRAILRNEDEISRRRAELGNARTMGADGGEVRRIEGEIAAAEARRAALQQSYANAQARQRQVEADWGKRQLEARLEAQREVEAEAEKAAKAREEMERRLADLRERREAEIAAARAKAIDETNRWFDGAMARSLADNMRGASVQTAADVARFQALTTGEHAQFARTATGLAMVGGGMGREERARVKTEHFQSELLKLVTEINRRYDEAENAATAEGEI